MLSLTTGVEFSSAALEAGAKCKAHCLSLPLGCA